MIREPRGDAGRIALDAARSILDAAAPVELGVEGERVSVAVERLGPKSGWISNDLVRPALRLDCRWAAGRARLLMSVTGGRGKSRPIGLRVRLCGARRHLVEVGVSAAIDRAADGDRIWVAAPFGKLPGEREAVLGEALRGVVERAGLPLTSARRVEAFAVRLPEGEVLPLPGDAFARLVHLSLLKLPFVARGPEIEGAPPFDARALCSADRAPAEARRPSGLLELLVLADTPGVAGTAQVKRLLEGLLGRRWETCRMLERRRATLRSLGLVERRRGRDVLTDKGRRALAARGGEAAEVRRRIEDLLEDDREADLDRAEALGATALEMDRDPPAWDADRLDLDAAALRPFTSALELPEGLLEKITAALSSGKHLLLVGPPGTGKTELALAVAESARAKGHCRGAFVATASADWTTFETIGGYALEKDGALRFRPGVLLSALDRREWLLVDELNRADADRAFGELLTVLSGRGTRAPFTLDDGRLVAIGPEPDATHRVPPSFRVLATLNTWDRGALHRLSYALQRRFAVVHVGVPGDDAYARLLDRHARAEGSDPPLDERSLAAMKRLFRRSGLLGKRAIGPAIALDLVRYARRRGSGGDGLCEAMAMNLLPQLEGLSPEEAAEALASIEAALAGVASAAALAELRERFAELFP